MDVPPRRRRACQACLERHVRCDRHQPCHRCKQNTIECVRPTTVRLTKSQLRKEKARPQAKHEHASIILDFLAITCTRRSDEMLELLRQDAPHQQITERLTGYEGDQGSTGSAVSNYTDYQEDTMNPRLTPFPYDKAASPAYMYDPRSQNHATFAMNGPGYCPLWQPERALDVFPVHHPFVPQQETLDAPFSSARTPPIWDCQGRNMSTTTITASLSMVECQRAMPSTRTRQLSDTRWSAEDAFALNTDESCRPSYRGRSPYKLITMPPKLVLDLTDAFFSWNVGSLPAVQRSAFVSDFLGQRTAHCSPALVRIISCLGCRALGGYDTRRSTYASLGNRLFQEAMALIVQSPACVPDVQACGLMALHQLKIGQAGDASDLAEEGVRRMAILMGREGRLEDSEESRWLEYSLCSAVALARFVRSMLDPIGDSTEYEVVKTGQ